MTLISKRTFLIVACVLSTALAAHAQTVRVEVSERVITLDDDIRVTFRFAGRGEAKLPNLNSDWTIGGRQQGSSTRIINGNYFRETTQVLVLVPKRTGKLIIPPAQILTRTGNSVTVSAESQPVVIEVRGIAALKPSEARNSSVANSMMLLPEFDRDIYYVGEPIVATWSLFVRGGQRISAPEMGELMVPEGVQRTDLLKGNFKQEGDRKFQGQGFARVPVFREIWKIMRPDVVEIGSLKANVSVGGDFFGSNTKRVKAPPLKLEIRGVPTQGRPKDYREGAIGQFTLTGKLKYDEEQGRALMELSVTGRGSLQTVDAPVLTGVTGAQVKQLPSDDRDRIKTDHRGIQGTRVFQYLLTPARAGTVFIPGVSLSYFDPETKTFRTTKSEPMQFVAKKAISSTRRNVVGIKGESSERQSIHSIEGESTLANNVSIPIASRWLYWLIIALPFTAWLGLGVLGLATRHREASSDKVRVKRALAHGKKQLKLAERHIKENQSSEFYAAVAKALKTYVLDKHSLTLAGMTNDQARVALSEFGYKPEATDRLVSELEHCDFARFAPGAGADENMRAALERALAVLTDLEATNAS